MLNSDKVYVDGKILAIWPIFPQQSISNWELSWPFLSNMVRGVRIQALFRFLLTHHLQCVLYDFWNLCFLLWRNYFTRTLWNAFLPTKGRNWWGTIAYLADSGSFISFAIVTRCSKAACEADQTAPRASQLGTVESLTWFNHLSIRWLFQFL